MPIYRNKPVEIEAFKLFEEGMPYWFVDEIDKNKILINRVGREGKNVCYINTLEGDMQADKGDYIIKDINGEIYPCKPDIFHKTYEKV